MLSLLLLLLLFLSFFKNVYIFSSPRRSLDEPNSTELTSFLNFFLVINLTNNIQWAWYAVWLIFLPLEVSCESWQIVFNDKASNIINFIYLLIFLNLHYLKKYYAGKYITFFYILLITDTKVTIISSLYILAHLFWNISRSTDQIWISPY